MAEPTTPEAAEAILVAHQRYDIGSCLCGWSELGRSHPGHQVAMLRDAGLLGPTTHGQQRAAQIQAVRDVMGWDNWDLSHPVRSRLGDLAAQLVDAVHAAGRDGQGELPEPRPDSPPTAEDRALVAAATGGRIRSREVLPEFVDEPDPKDRANEIAAWLDYRGLPPDTTLRELIEAERDTARLAAGFDFVREHQAELTTAADQGEARGWAKAVQALRDGARYEQWWNRIPRHPEATYWAKTGRDHLAGYLEAVGPDGTTSTGPVIVAHVQADPNLPEVTKQAIANLARAAARPFIPCELPVGDAWCALLIGHDGPCGPATAAETGQDGAGADAGSGEADTDGSAT